MEYILLSGITFFFMWLMLSYLEGRLLGFNSNIKPTEEQLALCRREDKHSMPSWGEPDSYGVQRRNCIVCNKMQRSDDRNWTVVKSEKGEVK